nr:AMP-binding protein [Sinobaca sp. H24]
MRTKPWLACYPDDVEYDIEIPQKSLFSMLEESALQFPKKEAVIEEDVRWTYETLYQNVIDLADSLKKIGFKEGDRAALLFLNTKEYIVTYFAVLYAGGLWSR